MSIRVGIVTNPLDPSTWEEIEGESLLAVLKDRFPQWPESARLYDMAGFSDWTRAAALIDPKVLSARDITPHDEASANRLASIEGPVLMTIPPADPLTAILTVVAIAVGIAAAFLLMPKLPGAQRQPSPNNALSARTNQARPNGRVPDIFGTVESTPDLLMVPYSIFENNKEVEIAFMCVGRGSYAISRVRDGDTSIASIAGSSASIYGPGTSPNSGDAPQLQIGAPIAEDVMSVVKLNEVNGQTLQPTNLDRVQGEDSIRFVSPDTLETNDGDLNFTEYFSPGDAINVAQADISGEVGTSSIEEDARFTGAGEIEFSSFNPSAVYEIGQQITVSKAGFADSIAEETQYIQSGEKNLFDASTVTEGYEMYGTGDPSPEANSSISAPIYVGHLKGQNIRFSGFQASSFARYYNFYTGPDTGAATLIGAGGTYIPDNVTAATIAVPANAEYMRFSPKQRTAAASDYSTMQVEAGSVTTSYAPFVPKILAVGGGILYVDLSGTYEIASLSPTKIELAAPGDVNSDWDKISEYDGDRTGYRSIELQIATETDGINLNGNYTILSLTDSQIVLNNPALVNDSWNNLADLPGGATAYVSPSLSRSSESWVGPFIVDLDEATQILINIVAPNGLYTLSKKKGKQAAMNVGFVLEATPVNSNDAAIGPAETFDGTIVGSSTEKTTVGFSLWADPTFTGRCSIRVRRTTPTPDDDDYGGIVDEIKWRDAYGLAPVEQEEFGDITTVHTRTIATPGALSLKERKLNMRVTRQLPQRVEGSTFGPVAATDSAADIISALALDPFIGRRSPSEVDFDNIYATVEEIEAYFGSELAAEFGYTFDDDDVSFEETVQTVAQAVFCQAYRQGRVLRLAFERASDQSSLIFNARNTLPGTQARTVRFGTLEDHDGVSLNYVDPDDGAALTFNIPADKTATSPRSLEIAGIRSYPLAFWQAWRAWNKLRYQNISVELEATQEAALVIPQDRVLIADMTRPNIIQGEIHSEDGTTLELSHPAPLTDDKSWTIFLQHIDGTVEPLGVIAGDDDYHVEVSAVPRMPLSIDAENFARATYMIVPDDDVQARAFLVVEREPQSNFTETVRAINYSFLYYQHDELILWLAFMAANFFDSGPYMRDGVAAGAATTVNDPDRGKRVFVGAGAGDFVTLPATVVGPPSYTKAAWINKAALDATVGNILSSAASTNEAFYIAGGQLNSWHNNQAGVVSADWPAAGEWHHAAVTYDADEGVTTLYIDGVPAASGETPQRPSTRLQAFGYNGGNAMVGRVDDLRLWKRALTASEIRAVFMASRSGA